MALRESKEHTMTVPENRVLRTVSGSRVRQYFSPNTGIVPMIKSRRIWARYTACSN